MQYLDLEMPLFKLKLDSVSPDVAKKFIWKMFRWLDVRVVALPHIVHLVTCSMDEIVSHAKVKEEDIEKIHQELREKYGLHFDMTDMEVRTYYNEALQGQPFGSTYKGLGGMEYLIKRYSLDEDVVESMVIYKQRYKKQKSRFRDIAYDKYSEAMCRAHIDEIHAFAAKVVKKNRNQKRKDENNQSKHQT